MTTFSSAPTRDRRSYAPADGGAAGVAAEMDKDPYPSRVADRPSITERNDPVLYTDPEKSAGPLSPDQLRQYERDGFLIFDDFLRPDELEAYARELDRMWDEAEDSDAEEVIREPDSDVVRSIFAVHQSDSLFERLARDPRLVRMAEQILNSPVYIHQSRINYKKGFDGKEFYWHSDFETWHVEDGMPRMRALSVSIALADNHPANGPLMLVPGSHNRYVACVGGTPKDHHKLSLRRQEYGVPDRRSLTELVKEARGITVPTGPAGSLIMFECNTMHGSGSNISPFPRSNAFFVYNSVENAPGEPYGRLKRRPWYIANRNFTPISSR